jgi:hypothetical protein
MGLGLAMGQKMAEALSGGRSGPPPLPAASPRYYFAAGGQQTGPVDLNGLRLEIQAGRLTRSSLVWKEGMSSWEPAERVPEVVSLFAAGAPPPLSK